MNMNEILLSAFNKQKKYAELVANGVSPDEALTQAFGSDIAEKTKQQLNILNQTRYN